VYADRSGAAIVPLPAWRPGTEPITSHELSALYAAYDPGVVAGSHAVISHSREP
jgi:hypothetical protein